MEGKVKKAIRETERKLNREDRKKKDGGTESV